MPDNYMLWNNDDALSEQPTSTKLQEGAVVLGRFLIREGEEILKTIHRITAESPFRKMVTPGGYLMSVSMTNCGQAGWVTDRRGYRYDPVDPLSGKPWPPIPPLFAEIATRAANAAGYSKFKPDACLINRYEPGAKLSLHQDKDEKDFTQPIVSVSLGLNATFLWGGKHRNDKVRRIRVEHGDVVVWGGEARLIYHGIDPLTAGNHPLLGECRINLTFRKAL